MKEHYWAVNTASLDASRNSRDGVSRDNVQLNAA